MGLDIGAGTIVECHRARGFELLRGTLSLAALERVDLIDQQRALRGGLLSRIRETNFPMSAESHFASLAFKHVPKTPTLCATSANAQIETPAISIETRFGRCRDLARGQPVELLCHGFPSTICGLGGGFPAVFRHTQSSAQSHKISCVYLWDYSERRRMRTDVRREKVSEKSN
jgi:hypothetical protein